MTQEIQSNWDHEPSLEEVRVKHEPVAKRLGLKEQNVVVRFRHDNPPWRPALWSAYGVYEKVNG